MKGLPSYDLELKAADQRQRIHRSVSELRACLTEALDVRRNAREHIGEVCAVSALLALASGYLVTGIFVRN